MLSMTFDDLENPFKVIQNKTRQKGRR